jgi:putative flavoprotein involved in K+ transport
VHDAVVVGAGPAGLAAAAMLRRHGVEVIVLDRAPYVGSSWRGRYDRLLLNSSRRTSYLPGLPFPRGPTWPARDEVVAYLERYARMNGIEPRFGVGVERVDRQGSAWRVRASEGDLATRVVVVATGPELEPVIPSWPGKDAFTGELLHSSAYRNAEPFEGKDVLVVGGGESAGDIVMDLADGGAARVWMSVRTPPHIFPEKALGIGADWYALVGGRTPPRFADVLAGAVRRFWIGDLTPYGLPAPATGFFTAYRRRGSVSAVIDRSGFVRALKARRFEVVAATERFDGAEVVLVDGSRLRPDAVVAATGYRCGLEPLVGHLGVLDATGHPLAHAPATHPRARGLYLFGYTFSLPNLRWLRVDAKRLGRVAAAFAGRR